MCGWDIYARSGFVFLCISAAVAILNLQLKPHLHDSTLRLAVAFAMVQVAATFAMAFYLVAQRSYTRFHESMSDQLRPAIQDHVSALAFSGQAWPTAIPKQGLAARVLEECLAVSMSGLRDGGRERLSQWVWEQGLAKQWQRRFSSRSVRERKRAVALLSLVSRGESNGVMRRALKDKEAEIRTEAARALLGAGDPTAVDEVFRASLGESLLIRVLLTADLKRHARHLLANTIPSVLAEGASPQMIRCLQILTVWKLAIPGFEIMPLLTRPRDPLILPLVLALLPYAPAVDCLEDHLRCALKTADLETQCAAAKAAGDLRAVALMPSLEVLLSQNARLAVTSASAMARMGAEGERRLKAVVAGCDRTAAAAAMEALENLAVGIQ